MKTLVIVRHGQSEWNRKNLFTGWVDVGLSDQGIAEAEAAGDTLAAKGFDFDVCYTSCLRRAIDTLHIILKRMDRQWLPEIKSYKLNERHYGALQGLNKAETAARYGEEQVHTWRRSFAVRPPVLPDDSPYNARRLAPYRDVPPHEIPMCESLADTIRRVVPYFEAQIRPQLEAGRRVLIAAHGNSLRALVKYFEHIGDNDIASVEIPTGKPLVYQFDDRFEVADKYYLADSR